MPSVSVIIPAYNARSTIKKTLESVFAQTHSDFEIIVINDGSTDDTLKICQEIPDRRLKIFSYENAGQAVSRNRGIERASGDYIAFLDADDLWTKNKLETQLQTLQNNPEAAVVYSWTDYIDENDNFLQSGRHINVEGNVYDKLLINNFIENGSNVLIRQQALQEVGGFEPSLPPAEDWDLWLRLARQYHFAVVPEPQILYRVSATSSSANLTRQEMQTLRVIDRAFAAAPPSYQSLKKRSLANLYKYLAWKALDAAAISKASWEPLRLTLNYIKYEPELPKEAKFAAIMLVKSAIAGFISPEQLKRLLAKRNKT
ncbi:glycosyltransferase [Oscillatoria sp. FACHB-1406]|uniref:glycosyltransferase n=1 Tax=Oscillatoria sp. FACHB-1406 TaxID=2692846 RepID=UPI001682D8B1|nr:glycosyltransferase [Oscillatoria sp. FACHB-1406]MBD2579595.1 glycosyltransferase [Oscillatoria sp. FACHB-1406]